MGTPPKKRPAQPDDLSYEDFDDVVWSGDAELAPIDLDALDDDIPEESAPPPPEPEQAAARLLDTLDSLDDDLTPPAPETPAPPAEPEQAAARLLDTLDSLDDDLTPPAPETPAPPAEPEPAPPVESEPPPAKSPARRTASITRTIPKPEPPTPDESAGALLAAPITDESVETLPAAPITDESVEVLSAAPSAEPEESAPAEPEHPPEPPPAPVIPSEVYCVLLPLPPELHEQVIELRKTGEITTMPPPGVVLTALFRTTDRAAVETALDKWTRAHLPFQFETTSVLAKVVGAQQYIAAWILEPEEELVEAQQALSRVLAELILPIPGVTFTPYVPIGEHIAAPRYPHVIRQMQRRFEPFVWRANDLQFVRQGDPPEQWETVKTFD